MNETRAIQGKWETMRQTRCRLSWRCSGFLPSPSRTGWEQGSRENAKRSFVHLGILTGSSSGWSCVAWVRKATSSRNCESEWRSRQRAVGSWVWQSSQCARRPRRTWKHGEAGGVSEFGYSQGITLMTKEAG